MIKIIYLLWLQGFDNAPEIVKKCLRSCLYYNHDWKIILLDNENISQYIDIDYYRTKQMSNNHLANFIRMHLLNKYGGLWVDATIFFNKPLSDWLPNYIDKGIFMFEKPSEDKLISNWFIYADKGHYIIKHWLEESNQYWINNDGENYFWMHYLFRNLYEKDFTFKQLWDEVPKYSANDPHYIQSIGMFEEKNEESIHLINEKVHPIYKLTWKCDFDNLNCEQSNLKFLFSKSQFLN